MEITQYIDDKILPPEGSHKADWQITATTMYCDAVDDNVTILVYGDWSTKCTGYKKYFGKIDKKTANLLKRKSKSLNREIKCEGPLDSRVTEYRDKLIKEEKDK